MDKPDTITAIIMVTVDITAVVATVAAMAAMPFGPGLFWHHVYKAFALLLYGEGEAAMAAIAVSEENRGFVPNLMMFPDHFFLDALIQADRLPHLPEAERAGALERIDRDIEQMRVWEGHCAENFRHRRLLMAAERDRVTGREPSAQNGYDAAIAASLPRRLAVHDGAIISDSATDRLDRGGDR